MICILMPLLFKSAMSSQMQDWLTFTGGFIIDQDGGIEPLDFSEPTLEEFPADESTRSGLPSLRRPSGPKPASAEETVEASEDSSPSSSASSRLGALTLSPLLPISASQSHFAARKKSVDATIKLRSEFQSHADFFIFAASRFSERQSYSSKSNKRRRTVIVPSNPSSSLSSSSLEFSELLQFSAALSELDQAMRQKEGQYVEEHSTWDAVHLLFDKVRRARARLEVYQRDEDGIGEYV